MRAESPVASNWRADSTLREYLVRHGIVAISDIDTRALTRVLRSAGAMRGIIATGDVDPRELVERARAIAPMEGSDLVSGVTCEAAFDWTPDAGSPNDFSPSPERQPHRRLKVAAYDFGMKWNILRRFTAYGCDVRVFPATAPASELLGSNPDGVFLSNGPGDPAALGYAVQNVKDLINANVPVFGICLGHQLVSLALGGRTYKLKFGHRGANHPVKEKETGRVEITSQNHGFAVDPASLPADVRVTHENLYDGTVEGLRHETLPVFTVQYHPEAAPGPHDADYLFRQFIDEMEKRS
jgi:carbamoyl-phosphate synthase small subunit